MANAKVGITIQAKDEAEATFRRIRGNLEKIGSSARTVGATLTASVTAPIVGTGIAAVKASEKWQTSMSNIGTLIGGNKKQIAEYSKGITQMMKNTPVSGADLGAAAYQTVSAGITKSSDALNVLKQSAKLGIAGLGSTRDSVNIVTSAINAFKMNTSKAGYVANIFFKTVRAGKTTVAELAQGFGSVAPFAATAGVQFDAINAATAALTTTGLSTSESQNSLRQVISSLLKPTKEATTIFKKLGVDGIQQLIKKTGGLVPALKAMREETKGNATQYARAMGSVQGLGAALSLTGAQNNTYTKTLEEMRNGTNAVNNAYKNQSNTLKAQTQLLQNSFNVALRSLGKTLLPMVTGAIKNYLIPALKSMASWWNGLSPTMKKVIVVFAAIVAIIPVLVLAFGVLVVPITAFVTLAGALSVSVLALVGWFLLIPVAIAVVVFAGYELIKHWGQIVAVARGAGEEIVYIFQSMGKYVTDVWHNMINAISNVMISGVSLISKQFGKLHKAVSFSLHAIEHVWKIVWGSVSNYFNGIWKGIKDTISSVVDYIAKKIRKIESLIKPVSGLISSIGSGIGSAFNSAMSVGRSALNIHDGIVQNGQIITTDPKDYIFATKNPSSLGGSRDINININGAVFSHESALTLGDMIMKELRLQFKV